MYVHAYFHTKFLFIDKKKLNITLGVVGAIIGVVIGAITVLIIWKCKQRQHNVPEKSK